MNWISKIFGRGDAVPTAAVTADFLLDLGYDGPESVKLEDALDALNEAGTTAVVDWADTAELVLSNLDSLFAGEKALSEADVETVLTVGCAAEEKGRGHAALPTICALDEQLNGTGERLLWIDQGGDCYELARVSDAIWRKWHDVSVGGVAVLAASLTNERPAKRNLSKGPR